MTFFFSHRPGSSDFSFFFHIFRMFTVFNVVYDHFLTRKTQFFTLFMLSRTSDNTTSQNIGGPMHGRSPPPQILGGPSPQSPPRSLPLVVMAINLCLQYNTVQPKFNPGKPVQLTIKVLVTMPCSSLAIFNQTSNEKYYKT